MKQLSEIASETINKLAESKERCWLVTLRDLLPENLDTSLVTKVEVIRDEVRVSATPVVVQYVQLNHTDILEKLKQC